MKKLDPDTRVITRDPHVSRPRRGRPLTILVTVAALAIGVTTATAEVLRSKDDTPAALQEAVDSIFAEGRCVTSAEAAESINAQLADLGYRDWVIGSGPGVQADDCVAAGLVAAAKRIILVPASGPEVAVALQGLATTLMNECLGKEEATSFISSVLTGLGQTEFTISTDGGLAYPEGQEQAVRAHIASGCFVYSAMGWDPDGRPVYYISGQEA